MAKKKNFGVIIFGILAILLGIWFTLQSIASFIGTVNLGKSSLIGLIGFSYLLAAYGLFKFKNWARYLYLLLMLHFSWFLFKLFWAINKVSRVDVRTSRMDPFTLITVIVALALPIFSFWYLNCKNTRQLFR